MALGTVLLGASIGQNLYSAISAGRKERRRRRKRSAFFDNELSPLLDEATQDVDVDFSSIYDAEMKLPLDNLQNGMRNLTRQRDATIGTSGIENSAFVQDDFANDSQSMITKFNDSSFQSRRGLVDMQSQLESIVSENKIRAKELEYSYKYG